MIFGRFLESFFVILVLTTQICLNADSEELEVTLRHNSYNLLDELVDEDSEQNYGGKKIEQMESDELDDTNYRSYGEGYELEDDMVDGRNYNYEDDEEIEELEDVFEEGDDYSYEDDDEIDEEFEYFYNQEMLGKLEQLEQNSERNSENISKDSLMMMVPEGEDDYEDSAELDIILDELLKEEELIDEVLDDFEESPEVILTETSTSSSLLTKALFLTSLVSVVVMVLLSICYTASAIFYRRVATEDKCERKEEKTENPIIRSNKKMFGIRKKDIVPPEWV